ncbi:acyltransferase [Pseudidiomarina salilacus]|uniref:acyltransferase n=1 Tax=Pseudidiomarina salilacus TaxID=3384452 RepID=UPI003984E9CB
MAFYSQDELASFGFKKLGSNVLISVDSRIYSPEKISIGSNVRVDDFCILSGIVEIGSNVHLAPGVQLAAGASQIILNDFSGLAFNVVVTASSDDYSGGSLTNPTVPSKYKSKKTEAPVIIGRHVIVGTGSFIMPGVTIGDGAAVGALALVNKSLPEWGVYVGAPARKVKERSKDILDLEKRYFDDLKKEYK